MRWNNVLFLFVTFFVFITSCEDEERNVSSKVNVNTKVVKDKLVEANKIYVKRESDEIEQYILHRGWDMESTGTGLRYMITKKGSGPVILPEKQVKVNYKISLLDGTVCYTSDSLGSRVFVVGMDNVESGLHEGIQLLHVGDKAVFVLPSHLAHGLLGDESKIPPRSSVIYDIEVLDMR